MNNVLCVILVISPNMAGLCREERLAVGPYWIFLLSHPGTLIGYGETYNEIDTVARAHNTQRKWIYVDGMTGVKCSVNSGKYWSNTQFSVFDFPGTHSDIIVKHAYKVLTKEGLRYTTTMYIKMNFWKIKDFRSSLSYRPWGILVGVNGSYPTKAVALLLCESRAYGFMSKINIFFSPSPVHQDIRFQPCLAMSTTLNFLLDLIWNINNRRAVMHKVDYQS